LSRSLRSVEQQDLLAFVLDEMNAVIHSCSAFPVTSVVKRERA
jgi:hypothetical protein